MKKTFSIIFLIANVFCFYMFVGSKVYGSNTKAIPSEKYSNETTQLQLTKQVNYDIYKNYFETNFPEEEVNINIFENYIYSDAMFDEEPYVDFFADDNGLEYEGLYIPETGNITFEFNVPETGYYNVLAHYFSVEGRSATIARQIRINGELPFREAANITFTRFWEDAYDVADKRVDGKDDLKPSQQEVHLWSEQVIRDSQGYYNENFYFHFEAGVNTISFDSNREPVVLGSLKLFQSEQIKTYEEVLKEYQNNGHEVVSDEKIKVQAESSYLKSSPTLAPVANFSSYKNEPYERFITRFNTIGGPNWRVSGDWVSWQVEVPESGLYKINFKVLQNYNRGMSSTRTLFINGKIPFDEAKTLTFDYDSGWQNAVLGQNGEPFLFYLEKGVNEIKLESNIGVYGSVARSVDEVILSLRELYRDVVMKTGVSPDPYQDYLLHRYIRNLNERIQDNIDSLEWVLKEVVEISGERGSLVGSIERTLLQLKNFLKTEKNIQNGLQEFEQNISALGSWVTSISNQPLLIDYLEVFGDGVKLQNARTNFFQKIWHEFILFLGSFRNTQSLNSDVDVDGPTVTVWIFTGKDQAALIRQLIDETFSTQKNIQIDLQLVSSAALLPATLTGNGPDIAIGVGENMPVNWGIRTELYDLTKFSDFNEVASQFHESAIVPYTFNDSVYALPDTQDFLVTYYRKDILEEIGIDNPPQTWDEVIDILPILQRNHLDYFLPNAQGALSNVLFSMINQYGGKLYLENGKYSGLMTKESTQAFIDYTRLYTDYGFVVFADFVNRFRSGEMPIGVSQMTTYNTLAVFAPEISGLWEYGLIPGTKNENGNINRMTSSTTSGTIMTQYAKDKDASWEFMKWWLGTETQVNYARGLEAILGSAARYPTANLKAFEQLPWPAKDYAVLKQARENAVGKPVVPGDYIVGRYIDNAYRAVLNDNINPYDSLYNYHLRINEELERKRKEFGL